MNTIVTMNAQTGNAEIAEILDKCWKVSIDVNCPSFRLTLDRSIKTEVKSNNFVEPMKDTFFVRYRQESRVFMLQHGVKFDGGYLVPEERIDEVMAGLADIAKRYVDNIDPAMEAWPKAVAGLIGRLRAVGEDERAAKVEDAFVTNGGPEGPRRSLGFRYSKYKISYSEDGDNSLVAHEATGLVGQVAAEIKAILAEKHKGNAKEGLRMSTWTKMFEAIYRKVDALSFLSPEVAGLSEVLGDVVLPMLKFKSKIDAADEIFIGGVVAQLNNIDAIVNGTAIIGIKILADSEPEEAADDAAWAKAQVASDSDETDGLFDDDSEEGIDAAESEVGGNAPTDENASEVAVVSVSLNVPATAEDPSVDVKVPLTAGHISVAQPTEISDW
jgi:hypothetical protein